MRGEAAWGSLLEGRGQGRGRAESAGAYVAMGTMRRRCGQVMLPLDLLHETGVPIEHRLSPLQAADQACAPALLLPLEEERFEQAVDFLE